MITPHYGLKKNLKSAADPEEKYRDMVNELKSLALLLQSRDCLRICFFETYLDTCFYYIRECKQSISKIIENSLYIQQEEYANAISEINKSQDHSMLEILKRDNKLFAFFEQNLTALQGIYATFYSFSLEKERHVVGKLALLAPLLYHTIKEDNNLWLSFLDKDDSYRTSNLFQLLHFLIKTYRKEYEDAVKGLMDFKEVLMVEILKKDVKIFSFFNEHFWTMKEIYDEFEEFLQVDINVPDRLMLLEPLLRLSMGSDNSLSDFLESDKKSASMMSGLSQELKKIIPNGVGENGRYQHAIENMIESKGFSIIRFLEANKGMLLFFTENMGIMEGINKKFKEYCRQNEPKKYPRLFR